MLFGCDLRKILALRCPDLPDVADIRLVNHMNVIRYLSWRRGWTGSWWPPPTVTRRCRRPRPRGEGGGADAFALVCAAPAVASTAAQATAMTAVRTRSRRPAVVARRSHLPGKKPVTTLLLCERFPRGLVAARPVSTGWPEPVRPVPARSVRPARAAGAGHVSCNDSVSLAETSIDTL